MAYLAIYPLDARPDRVEASGVPQPAGAVLVFVLKRRQYAGRGERIVLLHTRTKYRFQGRQYAGRGERSITRTKYRSHSARGSPARMETMSQR